MSLVLHYPFDQSDPTIAAVGTSATQQTIGTSATGTVTSTIDPTYGRVALFDDSAGLLTATPTEVSSNSPRTFSVWIKRDVLNKGSYFFGYGTGTDLQHWQSALGSNDSEFNTYYGNGDLSLRTSVPGAFPLGTWIHLAMTYDGTTLSHYVDGVLASSAPTIGTLNTPTGNMTIGYKPSLKNFDGFGLTGTMSDFRVYDDALDASTVSQLFADGPNDGNVPSLTLTPYTHLIDLDWSEVTGATTYYVRYIVASGAEQDLTTTMDLSYVFFNTLPGYSYEFRIYTDLDVITPIFTEPVLTPTMDDTNVESLLTRLVNDLTLLSEDSVDQFQSTLSSVLTTGDSVKTSVGYTTFVANLDALTLPEATEQIVFTPFDLSSGPGQAVSVVLPDTSTLSVSYDETSNEIGVGGTTYANGQSFVSGGLKITPKEI